jgi:hypothetical protein
MKSDSTSRAPNTGTRPAQTLYNAILLSMVSDNGADSQALPLLPTTSDSPESHAIRRKRLHLLLDLAVRVTDDEDEDDCSFMLLNAVVASSKNTSLKGRSSQ